MAALVEHLARLSHIDHAGLTERTPQKVLDQALDGFPVACLQTDALVHAETGVFPGTDVLDDFFGDFSHRKEKPENLLFPQLQKGFARQLGQRYLFITT